MIFRLYTTYNKYEIVTTGNQPKKNHTYYRKCPNNFAADCCCKCKRFASIWRAFRRLHVPPAARLESFAWLLFCIVTFILCIYCLERLCHWTTQNQPNRTWQLGRQYNFLCFSWNFPSVYSRKVNLITWIKWHRCQLFRFFTNEKFPIHTGISL